MRRLIKKQALLNLILCLLFLCLPVSALARPDSPPDDSRGGPGQQRRPGFDREHFSPEQLREKLLQKLNLNEQQKKAMQEFRSSREQLMEIGLDLKDKRDKINLMLKDQGSSEQEIRKELSELNRLMSELNQKRVENLLTLRKGLNPEQFKKVLRFIDAVQTRRAGAGQRERGPKDKGHPDPEGFPG